MCTEIRGNAVLKRVCFQILAGQWLRKPFAEVVFANSNLPEKRFRVFF